MISRNTILAVTAVTAGIGTLLASPAAVAPAQAQIPGATIVRYAPEGNRQLIFVNNPERLELGFVDTVPGSLTGGFGYSDLADPTLGNKLIHKITVPEGRYRDLYEHTWNATRSTARPEGANPVHYGVFVSNPNKNAITVTVYGKGFRTGFDGGRPIAEALNETAANPDGTTYVLAPGHLLWLQRTDVDYNGERAINPGTFFSGMVDFDVVGGPAVVANLAYQDFGSLTKPESDDESGNGNGGGKGKGRGKGEGESKGDAPKEIINAKHVVAEDMGFVWRRYNATAAPESRVYKGLMVHPSGGAGSTVGTNLAFTINDSNANANLPVTYPRYTNDSSGTLNRFSPSTQWTNTGSWVTHNVPIRDTAPTATNVTGILHTSTDMLDIITPGYGTLYALFQSNAPNTPFGQSNFGNWGVIYRDVVTVTNNGTRDRTVALRINHNATASNNAPIAYKDAAGVWQWMIVRNTPVAYRTFDVPAGQTVTVTGEYVLGCPGVGSLRHYVTLVK